MSCAQFRAQHYSQAEVDSFASALIREHHLNVALTVFEAKLYVFCGQSPTERVRVAAAPLFAEDPSNLKFPTPTPGTALPVPAPARCARISPNPPAAGQPTLPAVAKPPTRLVTLDLHAGTGRPATTGDSLSVTYIGIACSTGKVFDASYEHGNQPFTFTLGQAQVIKGWDNGLLGIRTGGVRELVIPPYLGYGAQTTGPIRPNETLIFLVTVRSLKPTN